MAITLLSGLLYLSLQQSLRMGANDPQIQLAEDNGISLANGASAQSLTLAAVNIDQSLAPFVIVYDAAGKELASSAKLQGQSPRLPAGVLEWVRQNGQDRLTWQPAAQVRIAAVVQKFVGKQSGFVLVGRSLRELEKRVSDLNAQVLAGWLAALLFTALAVGFLEKLKLKK